MVNFLCLVPDYAVELWLPAASWPIMSQVSSTGTCSTAALEQCSSQLFCPDHLLATFEKSMGDELLQFNALLLINVILALVIVGTGRYGHTYLHSRFTRFIFIGATTMFLPIISNVITTIGTNSSSKMDYFRSNDFVLTATCSSVFHSSIVITWAFFVQIAVINTRLLVAGENKEGRNDTGPPFDLLVQSVWTLYLCFSIFKGQAHKSMLYCLEFAPFALICAKILLKYYTFEKAQRSVAVGRNSRLILGYMQQLRAPDQQGGWVDGDLPPLLVMGEDKMQVELHPYGYAPKSDQWSSSELDAIVTMDKVWDSTLLLGALQQMDLCLSFALFKLLQCRLGRHKQLANLGSVMETANFLWRTLLMKDGEHTRVFKVIADELSFVHDYYYSSLPVCYSNFWLPILSISISLLSIGCCILVAWEVTKIGWYWGRGPEPSYQILCELSCNKGDLIGRRQEKRFGSLYFDCVLVFILLLLVVITEAREIATYIFSNWTKVAIICRHGKHTSLQWKWWDAFLLRCRSKLMYNWEEKTSQCSVLVLHRRIYSLDLLRNLLHMPDIKRRVKVPEAVKVSIIDALRGIRSGYGHLSNGTDCLCRCQDGEMFLWAWNNTSTSYTILTWHIATSIVEVRYRRGSFSSSILNSEIHMIAAIHLSQYCAYLVTWSPELLPDDDEWSRSLYQHVKNDALRALADHAASTAIGSLTPEEEYQRLVEVLSANSKHEVLKNGVKLGKQLVETIYDDEAIWKLLAEFWSEMILYVAPSDNLKGHSEAIARGGELITLLWALLFHVGIVSRPGEDDGPTATFADAV
ncbi:unnamed protein product [Urochloa decumbens]|uniref:DUF4220 domain-containing protein n=3 Tax=Urochloa decumbens TaxID=240449 RepID=A0ABC9H8Y7_9POAL